MVNNIWIKKLEFDLQFGDYYIVNTIQGVRFYLN